MSQTAKILPIGQPAARTVAQIRQYILEEVGVLENLVNLAQGKAIEGIKHPEPDMVYKANIELLNRCLPTARSVEVSGPDGGAIQVEQAAKRIVDLIDAIPRSGGDSGGQAPLVEYSKTETDSPGQ